MTRKLITLALSLCMVMLLAGTAGARPRPTSAGITSLQAVVMKQHCTKNGAMRVTLSAIAPRSFAGIRYTWDLTSNGSYETVPSLSPRTQHTYLLTTTSSVTATVGAFSASTGAQRASVTFGCVWAQPGG
jgi:hypothetical protein